MESRVGEFRFLTINCKTCKFNFIITPSEQEFYLKKQLSIPVHCPECRQKRKQAKLNGQGGDCR
jgi:Zn finger protein HypA/HybF involved in hydrogenase expression